MIKRAGIIAAAFLLLATACSDDNVIRDCFSCKCNPAYCPPKFEELTKRSNVLNNFAVAHNKRDIGHYDALLDDNFTFFYDEPRAPGPPLTVQVDRATDVATTTAFLAGTDRMEFELDIGGLTWAAFPAPGGTENWYSTTVFYHFTIKIGNTTYIPNVGASAQFTVRNAGTSKAPKWQLVELRDLGGPTAFSAAVTAATEPTTYGLIKAKFRS